MRPEVRGRIAYSKLYPPPQEYKNKRIARGVRGVAHGAWQRSGGPAGALLFFRSWNDEKGVGAE